MWKIENIQRFSLGKSRFYENTRIYSCIGAWEERELLYSKAT